MARSSSSQLKIGIVLSYLAIGINILTGLIYTPWMLSMIGDSDYGLYTLATSIISIFTVDFGMSAAVARFVAKYRVEGRQDKVDRFLGLIYKLYLIIDAVLLVVLVVAYFFVEQFATGLTAVEMERFKVVFIIVATYSVLSFPFVPLNGILSSYEKFIELKSCEMLNKIVTTVVTILALVCGLGLYALVLINVIVHMITIAIKWMIINRNTPARVRFERVQKDSLKDIFNFSFWTTVVSVSKRFLQNIMPVLLSNICTTVQITIYGLGGVIEGYAYILVSAIAGMLMPRISKIVAGDNREKELNALLCKVGRFQYFIMGLIFVGFFGCGEKFVVLCYGASRVDAYYVALLMILPHLFYAPQQIAQTTVTVENKVKLQAFVHVFAALVNIALTYVLARGFGAIGAALSICIVYLLRMLCMNVIYHTVLKLNMLRFYYECYIKMGAPILLTGVFSIGLKMSGVIEKIINGIGGFEGWIELGATAVVICVLYFGLMWLIGFNKEEKKMLCATCRKIAIWKR